MLPELAKLYATKQVELRADPEAAAILQGYPHLAAATQEDWSTEYLAPILAVKVVADIIVRLTRTTTIGITTSVHEEEIRRRFKV